MIAEFDFTTAIDKAVKEVYGTQIYIENEQQLKEA